MTPVFSARDVIVIIILTILVMLVCAIVMHGNIITNDDIFDKSSRRRNVFSYGIPVYWMAVVVILLVAVMPGMFFLDQTFFYGFAGEMLLCLIPFMALYMTLLAIVMPILKKRLSATACVIIWLLPNLQYVNAAHLHYVTNAPAVVIKIPAYVMHVVLLIWMAGFLIVLTKGVIEHRRFKKDLFKNSHETSEHVCHLYHEVRRSMGAIGKGDEHPDAFLVPRYKDPIVSPGTKTPLAIGFNPSGTHVVLPEKEYTDAELRLIFRHEWIHILRRDGWTKLFLLICRAMCWFLPSAWKATEEAAEEIELSCDEMVLCDEDDDVKKEYGRLILSTASNAAGFTTCLSASAESMKYRLQRILESRKRSMGLPVIALAFLLFVCGTRIVTFAVDYGTVADLLNRKQIRISDNNLIAVYDNEGNSITRNRSKEEWTKMLLEKHLYSLVGRYSYKQDGDSYTMLYITDTAEEKLYFVIADHSFSIGRRSSYMSETVYYME